MARISLCLLLAGCGAALAPLAAAGPSVPPADDVEGILDRADALLWLGIAEDGAGHSFEQALELVDVATKRLASDAGLPPNRRKALALEADVVREDLELLVGLYDERFYGRFPLARLTIPTVLLWEGHSITEQLFHPPEVAATEIAARSLSNKLREYGHPGLVTRSASGGATLENLVLQVLMREGQPLAMTRGEVLRALGDDALVALDRGPVDPVSVDRLMKALDTASLVVVTVDPIFTIDEHTKKVVLSGEVFVSGEFVQGSPVDASLVIRGAKLVATGTVRDRQQQFWPITVTQLLMLALAMAWAAGMPWNLGQPLKMFFRLAVGFALFAFGRIFILVVVVLLRRVIPPSSALVAASWWWPAILGLVAILGGGFVAWLGQARLTDIVPGARGARAIGSIFALTALGAGSFFVTPLLLLDGSAGFSSLFPFIVASLGLAVLFGFAARTGPPVPHYFMVGPLLVAPLVGAALLMASPGWLWTTVGLTGLLYLAAWIRHRHAVARGTEEPEPTPEEAAAADQQTLDKLGQKLKKH